MPPLLAFVLVGASLGLRLGEVVVLTISLDPEDASDVAEEAATSASWVGLLASC